MSATAVGVSKEHITKTPGVCGGRACVAGTRIRVMDIVHLSETVGLIPAQILEMYPHITVSDVYAALAYYHDNRDEIAHDFEVHRRAEEHGRTQPSLIRDAIAKDPSLLDRFPELRERFGG